MAKSRMPRLRVKRGGYARLLPSPIRVHLEKVHAGYIFKKLIPFKLSRGT